MGQEETMARWTRSRNKSCRDLRNTCRIEYQNLELTTFCMLGKIMPSMQKIKEPRFLNFARKYIVFQSG